MGFFSQLRYRLQQWMYGRNGVDLLSRDLNILAFILMFLDILLRTHIIYWVGFAVLVLAFFRVLSRNIPKRTAENIKYLSFRNRIKGWFTTKRQQFANRKYYRYFICKTCRQKLRVPRGKGKIEISCPKCGNHFIKVT
ncbi:hypothetical protein [Acetanaerobacterium elongatum]|uniref:Zn-finger containing protein n=1 Tax=Acetanaerobacterium elongatum TaxID=258515 RepID=A0A1H0A3U9_9FIRM|nr:hypothetical protein [Acetanaerobacterium elongatum]SDN27931.1 hypothetical protein SAMN05192585_11516 [Acetanaerobacterium elongatum]